MVLAAVLDLQYAHLERVYVEVEVEEAEVVIKTVKHALVVNVTYAKAEIPTLVVVQLKNARGTRVVFPPLLYKEFKNNYPIE